MFRRVLFLSANDANTFVLLASKALGIKFTAKDYADVDDVGL